MSITSKEAVNFYKEASKKLSEMILDLSDLQDQADSISKALNDNFDPAGAMQESLEKLAIALAWTVSYGSSYEEDANKNANKKEN